MNESFEFTPREKFLINYYRDRNLSLRRVAYAGQLGCVFGALAFAGMFFWTEETAWLLVGFILLIYRVCSNLWSSGIYAQSFGNIFEKYEARIAELESNQKVSQ